MRDALDWAIDCEIQTSGWQGIPVEPTTAAAGG